MKKLSVILCAVAPLLSGCAEDQSVHGDAIAGLIVGLSVGESSHIEAAHSRKHHAHATREAKPSHEACVCTKASDHGKRKPAHHDHWSVWDNL